MATDLQNLWSSDGSPWSVKFFKEKMLTALTVDLSRREESGIEHEVCETVYSTLNAAVAITQRIKDGSFFEKHFFVQLEKFKDIYFEWNGVKERNERKKKHKELLDSKGAMFSTFYKQMDKLKKTDNEERIKQYELLSRADRELLDSLVLAFDDLVKKYGKDLFKDTRRELNEFRKRRGKK
jgi:hypothetical protein